MAVESLSCLQQSAHCHRQCISAPPQNRRTSLARSLVIKFFQCRKINYGVSGANKTVMRKLKISKGALNGVLTNALRGPAGGLSFTEVFDFSLALNPEYDIFVYH